ncbi:MAG: 3-hydroxyacyl-CoA dehydrogenase NAD-binding domain-containing protein, partial [Candidatus Korarchaeum sp.]|nr:3-hydroxyacyl-CoA dehydrogenase NAD-binding domain-containing protein [Candidatus Korarchaeum sp.]
MNESFSKLKERILSRDAKISVIGQGYIGLPLALLLADSGFNVIGYDVNPEIVEELSNGKTRMESENGIRELLLKHLRRNYLPTNDIQELIGSDIIVIAVPTPRKDGSADLSMVMQAV